MQANRTRELAAVCFGEMLGTFLLVLIGTATVAAAVLFNAHVGLLQVAVVWGVGVTLAIYSTRHLSRAHLNPAVSLAMVLMARLPAKRLPWYWAGQLLGGVLAGVVVLTLFGGTISGYEATHGIVRGAPESVQTAMIFGEYFPNPGFAASGLEVSRGVAMFGEALGTFVLVMVIFLLTEGCNPGRPAEGLAPVFIGACVTAIIAFLAPLTQCGINPARDFGPRLVAWLAGWDSVAIPGPRGGFFLVYILAPLIGGAVSAVAFRFVVAPLMTTQPPPLASRTASAEVTVLREVTASMSGEFEVVEMPSRRPEQPRVEDQIA